MGLSPSHRPADKKSWCFLHVGKPRAMLHHGVKKEKQTQSRYIIGLIKKNEVEETKKRASLKEDYMGNVPWRRCGVVKQPPQLIRCQKQKKKCKRMGHETEKNVGNALRKWWVGGSHRANVCVLLETMPAKKESICKACAQLKHITIWCAQRNTKK